MFTGHNVIFERYCLIKLKLIPDQYSILTDFKLVTVKTPT